MANIASALKEEITRLARKELRVETEGLKKASAQYRSDIAALKRRLADLEKQVARLAKSAPKKPAPAEPEDGARVRYTAKGLRTLRQRLGLSAADFGALISVSAQTVYNWEAETTSPRQQQVIALAGLRGLGKKEAAERLAQIA